MSSRTARFGATGRVVLSLVFVGVIYADVANLLLQSDLAKLPFNPVLGYYNRMFNVFGRWSTEALGFVAQIQVRRVDAPDSNWEWLELDVHELFPMPRGESFVRLSGMNERNRTELARQLLAVYRRRHPELEIAKLRLCHATWPLSTAGYRARYGERRLTLIARA